MGRLMIVIWKTTKSLLFYPTSSTRLLHLESVILTKNNQILLDEIKKGDFVYVLQSSIDSFVHGLVESSDDTHCNITIDENGSYLAIPLHDEKFQKYLRQP